ncbi:MAG: hypothetical protein ACLTSG_01980 [Lachnospiraceae bacterium]
MYEIKRGGHADMKRIYPMLEHDFHEWERPSLADCHLGLIRGAELLLLKDESGLEAGYAYMLRDAARRYALLGWLAVYPTIRGAGTGAQFLELIKARYARYECVFIEVTEYPELEKARRLAGFYKRHGWCETGIPYAIGGRGDAAAAPRRSAAARRSARRPGGGIRPHVRPEIPCQARKPPMRGI